MFNDKLLFYFVSNQRTKLIDQTITISVLTALNNFTYSLSKNTQVIKLLLLLFLSFNLLPAFLCAHRCLFIWIHEFQYGW